MSPTAEGKAMAFAHDTLGVERVYEAATKAHNDLAAALERVVKTASDRRRIDDEITDHEMTIIAAERGRHADLSQAAFDKHIKQVLWDAPQLAELRSQRAEVQTAHERADADADLARGRIRLESARMEELGGLLTFYASTKFASGQRDHPTTTE
jgi:hypothetical protein